MPESGVEACIFAMRSSGGAGIRAGDIRRIFRNLMTAARHFTINLNIVGAVGGDIGGI